MNNPITPIGAERRAPALRSNCVAHVPVFLLLSCVAALLLLTSCSQNDGASKPADVDYYTCTMHPSVHSQDPHGKCPICSMSLVPVKKRGATGVNTTNAAMPATNVQDASRSDVPTEFSVPVERQQQIGVTYGTVEKQPFTHTVRAVGTVTYDKQRHWDFVARVDGYVQKLQISSRGDMVEKGQPLMTLYSPGLLTTQREFLDLLRMRDDARRSGSAAVQESAESLIDSARRRLLQWNVTPEQVAQLEKTGETKETLTLYSPFAGVVQDLPVDQGRRVAMGDRLVDVADLSTVWVWAQFYEDEVSMLKKGLPVTITTASYPGEKFNGRISVVDPFINDALRTSRVRIEVENHDLKLRPDMYVDAELTMDMGENLAVPVPAVLPTGKHNIVFVDKGGGKLEPRFVELGRQYGDFYEVKSGVKETERVVTSANFLIDAEAKIQGALKSW